MSVAGAIRRPDCAAKQFTAGKNSAERKTHMEYKEYNPDNELFAMMGEANSKAVPARQQGYYVCSRMQGGCGTDFIKPIAKKKQPCPFCGSPSDRLLVMDPAEVLLQYMIWRESGIYSDKRAGTAQKMRKGA